jgi:hypothetical protein
MGNGKNIFYGKPEGIILKLVSQRHISVLLLLLLLLFDSHLTAEARVRYQEVPVGFVVEKIALG